MQFFSRFALAAVLMSFVFIGAASATPMTCPTTGNYADLMATDANGGCYVADKLFSNFTYQTSSTGGAIEVPSTSFTYTTVANAPAAVGFQFGFSLTALANQTNDILISWLVTGPDIQSNHLTMAGNATGNAAASIVETYCKGGPIAGCPESNSDVLFVYASDFAGRKAVDNAQFPPVRQLGVFKDINVAAGAGGFATISGMIQTVDQIGPNDQVPEPGTMFIGGASLLGLGLLRRFRVAR